VANFLTNCTQILLAVHKARYTAAQRACNT